MKSRELRSDERGSRAVGVAADRKRCNPPWAEKTFFRWRRGKRGLKEFADICEHVSTLNSIRKHGPSPRRLYCARCRTLGSLARSRTCILTVWWINDMFSNITSRLAIRGTRSNELDGNGTNGRSSWINRGTTMKCAKPIRHRRSLNY